MSEDIDLVLSGSGTLVPCHVGAVARLQKEGFTIRRVAGTSGGAIVAAAVAHGWSAERMQYLARRFLRGGLLDRNWFFPAGWGMYRGNRILSLFREHLPGQLEDAGIPLGIFALDLETQRPALFSRENSIETAHALRASVSIPLFFRAHKIPGERGLFVDGGVTSNFALGVWDDVPERKTVGIRFRSRQTRRPIRHGPGFVTALVGSMLHNANRSHISKKRFQDVITIDSAGNSLDFTLSELEVEARFDEGWRAADKWIKGGKNGES